MRSLPYVVTGLLSIVVALGLFLWIDGRLQKNPVATPCAPDMRYAAQKGREATVFVTTQMTEEQEDKKGSGVIISHDGYVITNYHVISHRESIRVWMHNDKHYTAEVIGTDSTFDLALLRIHGTDLPFLEFGDSDALEIGENVLAVGNPYKLNFTITSGIISAINRDLGVTGNATRTFIQTDVPINSGNSGGPLINARGQLMGIMGIMVTVSGQYEGYSFAMPSNLVRKIIDDLRQYSQRQKAVIGMVIRPVTREIAEYAKMPEVLGVVVDALADKGAADLAGVQSLDIIISADGQTVKSVAMFLSLLPLYSPGDTIHLVVNRDGIELPFDVVFHGPD